MTEAALNFDWAYANGAPSCHGVIRATAEDFQVDEVLAFDPDGEGHHALVHIRKRNTNTEWLARQLAEFCGVEPKEVGYAGLKDRHAVTTQYFSINLSGRQEPDWSQINSEEIEIISVQRHGRKLRRGDLRENRFVIRVRELSGECTDLETRLQQIMANGVPNYFGEQRFGHHGNNLRMAQRLFAGELKENDRHKRGLYLSAARSWLFNRVLSHRVAAGCWLAPLPGEALIQPYSRSTLTLAVISDEIRQRIDKGLLQPSAPLWGRGSSSARLDALTQEQQALEGQEALMQGLEQAGLQQERRALRLMPKGLKWHLEGDASLSLYFALSAGAYATALLRELVVVKTPDQK